MNFKNNRLYYSFLMIFFIIACENTTNNEKKDRETSFKKSDIIGKWKVIKALYIDPYELISNNDKDACWDQTIYFTKNSIFSNSTCFKNDSCKNVQFNLNKENAMDFFENDTSFINKLDIIKDSLVIIETNCNIMFKYIYMIDKNEIVVGKDNFLFFLEKQ